MWIPHGPHGVWEGGDCTGTESQKQEPITAHRTKAITGSLKQKPGSQSLKERA